MTYNLPLGRCLADLRRSLSFRFASSIRSVLYRKLKKDVKIEFFVGFDARKARKAHKHSFNSITAFSIRLLFVHNNSPSDNGGLGRPALSPLWRRQWSLEIAQTTRRNSSPVKEREARRAKQIRYLKDTLNFCLPFGTSSRKDL